MVSAPAPPALRIAMVCRAARPTDVPSTTNVSERVAAPPWLSTVSSLSVPPLEMKVPGPGDPGLPRAGDHEHVASDRVALQIDDARVGERRRADADQVALQRPTERHGVVGVSEREILPRAVERGGACHCGERQRSVVAEAVVWAGAEVRYGHAERIATPSPLVSAKCLRLNDAIVEEAVNAAAELHEARDRPGVLDLAPDPGVVPLMARSDRAPTVLPASTRAKPFKP